MELTLLRCKLHRATVTEANLNYVGSVTIDEALMKASGLVEYEKVQIVNINSGSRFETYVIKGAAHSGTVCLNGAAARLVQVGDKIIIMSYARLSPDEAAAHRPRVALLGEKNQILEVIEAEAHGELR